ncbi:MAG: hypothetical protein JETT_3416 [Candidatus Jettenia ecosi]|uniref:Uncharacterized protein n=1 Tax=Candidatus Jettenia ecosi TaxID=2494326 RepID=A0A533Q6T3_9BACT|nr:MAG: hypothetical protein JETT_3416 [Candidatus Jettenia ecosi]
MQVLKNRLTINYIPSHIIIHLIFPFLLINRIGKKGITWP